jgi:hypothetical protein
MPQLKLQQIVSAEYSNRSKKMHLLRQGYIHIPFILPSVFALRVQLFITR